MTPADFCCGSLASARMNEWLTSCDHPSNRKDKSPLRPVSEVIVSPPVGHYYCSIDRALQSNRNKKLKGWPALLDSPCTYVLVIAGILSRRGNGFLHWQKHEMIARRIQKRAPFAGPGSIPVETF